MYDGQKGVEFNLKHTIEVMGSTDHRMADYSPILLNVY